MGDKGGYDQNMSGGVLLVFQIWKEKEMGVNTQIYRKGLPTASLPKKRRPSTEKKLFPCG